MMAMKNFQNCALLSLIFSEKYSVDDPILKILCFVRYAKQFSRDVIKLG